MIATRAEGHRNFSGKLDPAMLNLDEPLISRLFSAPSGDFRDWEMVRRWAREIAAALETDQKPGPGVACESRFSGSGHL